MWQPLDPVSSEAPGRAAVALVPEVGVSPIVRRKPELGNAGMYFCSSVLALVAFCCHLAVPRSTFHPLSG